MGVGVWGEERNNTIRGQLSVSVGERANIGPWGLNGDGEGGLGAGGEEASPEGARYAWSGEGRGGGDSGTGSLRPFKTHTVRTRGGGRRSRTGLKTTRRQVAPSSRAPRSACALFSLGRGWCSTTSPPNREPHRLPSRRHHRKERTVAEISADVPLRPGQGDLVHPAVHLLESFFVERRHRAVLRLCGPPAGAKGASE